jgi:hypothetical protein
MILSRWKIIQRKTALVKSCQNESFATKNFANVALAIMPSRGKTAGWIAETLLLP